MTGPERNPDNGEVGRRPAEPEGALWPGRVMSHEEATPPPRSSNPLGSVVEGVAGRDEALEAVVHLSPVAFKYICGVIGAAHTPDSEAFLKAAVANRAQPHRLSSKHATHQPADVGRGCNVYDSWDDVPREWNWPAIPQWTGNDPICVTSSPAKSWPEGKDAMAVCTQVSARAGGLVVVGFDFANSRNSRASDQEFWDQLAIAQPDEKEAILIQTEWWHLYEQQVIGNAKATCQYRPEHRCIIFCINGGPISQVEASRMPGIIANVDLPSSAIMPEFVIHRGDLDAFEAFVEDGLKRQSVFCHLTLQPPPVSVCDYKSKQFLRDTLEELGLDMRREGENWESRQQFPVTLSDASSTTCDLENDLRNGRLHSFVWCGKGEGFEERSVADTMPSLERIGKIIVDLHERELADWTPRVAVICLEFGAEHSAKKLATAGVSHVLWVSTDAIFDPATCAYLISHVIAPALHSFDEGGGSESVVRFLQKTMFDAQLNGTAGCCSGSDANLIQWKPKSKFDEQWLRNIAAAPLRLEPRGKLQSSLSESLPLLACDLEHLQQLQLMLEAREDGKLNLTSSVIIMPPSGQEQEVNPLLRCRAIALALCMSHLFGSTYNLVCRISDKKDLQDLESQLTGLKTPVLVWIDLNSHTVPWTNAELKSLCETLRPTDPLLPNAASPLATSKDPPPPRHVILTYGDADSYQRAIDLGDEGFLGVDHCLPLNELSSENAQGVQADGLHEEFKVVSMFEKGDEAKCLLDAFAPQEIEAALKELLDGRPVVGM